LTKNRFRCAGPKRKDRGSRTSIRDYLSLWKDEDGNKGKEKRKKQEPFTCRFSCKIIRSGRSAKFERRTMVLDERA